ncbi:MAG: metallophosphoesterase family protein [Brachymonas sp.]|nr:metallophosphoesterase family protein [Brachymonas sp.]
MRLALVSDIHGNLAALEAVATDIKKRGADAVLNLGDHLSGPLLPRETAQFLMASGWLCLAGNHERQLLACAQQAGAPSDQYAYSQLQAAERDWVRSLQPTCRYSDTVLLCHGTPHSDCTYLAESVRYGEMGLATQKELQQRLGPEYAAQHDLLIACGHTHVPRSVRMRGGPLIVNPGSVGLQAYSDDQPEFHIMQTGSPDARYAIIEQCDAGWQVELHSVPYDHASMVQLARQRGEGFAWWEQALLHGRAA